jgi:hypothetical protein
MTTPVLIVGHADGYIEAFAPHGVSVRTAIVPDTHPGKAELLALAYVRANLPRCYAELWEPGNMRCNENVRCVTVEEIVRRQNELELLAVLNSIQQEPNESGVTCLV